MRVYVRSTIEITIEEDAKRNILCISVGKFLIEWYPIKAQIDRLLLLRKMSQPETKVALLIKVFRCNWFTFMGRMLL